MTFTPITPVLVVRNISKYDVNILGRVKLRPGEQKDLYAELEYNEFGSLTSTVLKELESPSGEIYRLWKVLNAIRVIEFVNPTHVGSGVSADSFSTSNDYFEGAVLGFESGELKWLVGGGGGSITAVTASSPLSSSGGATPDISLGTVGVAKGGTGQTSLTANAVILGNGALAVQTVAPGTSGNVLTSDGTTWSSAPPLAIEYDQQIFVSDGADPLVATGAPQRPFASISAAMAAITDAAPTKRYAIRVETGAYREASALILKPNVFIIGSALEAARITAPSFGLDATFTGAADNQSGVMNATLAGPCSFDFNAVTSSQGKMYFQRASFVPSRAAIAAGSNGQVLPQGTINVDSAVGFSSTGTILVATSTGTQTVTYTGTTATSFTGCTGGTGTMSTGGAVTVTSPFSMNGNSTINQAQFDSCTFFGTLTFSGVSVGVFANNRCFTSIVLNQHASVATVLNATGGFADSLTATAAVNDFNRRCSVFTRGLKFDGTVTVDGPSAYVDYTVGSLPAAGATVLNGGNLVSVDFGANKALSNLVFPTAVNNPIMPANTNATNFGDWGKQWFWNFGYLHASTGTDCYLVSYPSSFGAEATAGKNVYALADAAGLAANINGGGVGLFSSNATGTGASGGVEAETGTAVNGNSGSITLTTGAVSGTGTRGIISLDGRQIDANSTKIVNLANGVNANDAVNKSQLDNTVASFSGGTTGLTPSTASTGAVTLGGTLAVGNGGTGLTAAPTNGQLLVGNGTGYTLATLSEGTGIEITESAGSITIAATGAASSTSVEVPLTTTGLSNGDVVCVDTSANSTVKKADADVIDTSRVLGVVSGANKVQVSGIALATFASAPNLGAVAYLSNTEGVLTTTVPTSGVVAEVGIVVSAAVSAGKYSVLLQVKTPVQLV